MKTILLISLVFGLRVMAEDFSTLCANRVAVERVYHEHRLGQKPAFERAVPRALIERFVKQDLHKEAVLKRAYGVEISPALIDGEVRRINSTTRAPDVLAEIKAVLGNDPVKFASTVAKPIVVERLLRNRFENDDTLHASQRREAEIVREQLLKASKDEVGKRVTLFKQLESNRVSELTFQLASHRMESNAPAADELEIKKRFGPSAQILSAPHVGPDRDQKFYFDDLPVELQRVLGVQLRQAGDVSAVIETPGGFLLYLAREKTDAVLSVACLSLAKRSYEQWLEEQTESVP